jgi:hypothetical protein
VFADGFYFRGSGNAVDETVTIYADAGGVPGSVISEQTVAGTDDESGYTIALTPVKLRPGSYWVSVVSNQAFEGGGQWGWVRSTRSKSGEAVYENPGDGWGTGCTTWTALTTCAGGDGVSMMMQIRNY